MSLTDNQQLCSFKKLKAILEYIFEDEKIFYAEKCDSNAKADNNTEVELCQEAKEYYNFIFTCCVISSVSFQCLVKVLSLTKTDTNLRIFNPIFIKIGDLMNF